MSRIAAGVREPIRTSSMRTRWLNIAQIAGARRIPLGLFQAAIPTRNLMGGILAWSDAVDPTVVKY